MIKGRSVGAPSLGTAALLLAVHQEKIMARAAHWSVSNFDLQGLRLFATRYIPTGWLGPKAKISDGISFLEETLKLKRYSSLSDRSRPDLTELGPMGERLIERCTDIRFEERDISIGKKLGIDIRQLFLLTLPGGQPSISATCQERGIIVRLTIKDAEVRATFEFRTGVHLKGNEIIFVKSGIPSPIAAQFTGRPVSKVAELPRELARLESLPIKKSKRRGNHLSLEVKASRTSRPFQAFLASNPAPV